MWADIECTSRLIDRGVDDCLGHKTLEIWGTVNDIMKSTEEIKNSQQKILTGVQVKDSHGLENRSTTRITLTHSRLAFNHSFYYHYLLLEMLSSIPMRCKERKHSV